jgi:phage terminase large subunit-like protein
MSNLELSMDEWYNLCLARPDVFAHYYFDHIIRSPSSTFHFLLYDLIAKISNSKFPNNIAIAAPRGNAKTQIIHVILPIWCIAFEQKKFIVMASDTSRQVEGNLESIKYELTTNEKLADHFPHIMGEGPKWKKEEIDTNNGVRVVALGSGKKFRGAQKVGAHRPDLVLLDDMENDENVLTKAQREKLEEWFVKAILGMAGADEPGNIYKMDVVVTGTILHPKSLLAKLLSKTEYMGWEKHIFKAVISSSKSPLWTEWRELYTSYTDPDRKVTARKFYEEHEKEMLEGVEVLWPEGEPYYKLQEYIINAGHKAFSSEKQNNPIDPSSVLFDSEKIMYYNREDVNIDDLVIYGALDPASGDAKKKGDLTAIVTIGKNPKTGIIYVLDVKADNTFGPSDSIRYIKRMHELYDYKYFGVDSDALKMYKDLILKEIPHFMGRLKLYDLRVPKRTRIDRLEPSINSGIIKVQKTQTELIDELIHHPKSEYDDVLDALEIATRLAGNRRCRLLTY